MPGMRPNRIATARVSLEEWPVEPASPAEIDVDRLGRSLDTMCDYVPPGRSLRYADWIVRYAQQFGEDPFLLGALVYRQTLGTCRPDYEGPYGGLGLTDIRREMYADDLRDGTLRYRVRQGGRWVDRSVRLDRFPFAGPRLRRAEENLYFAAALLSVWRDQHATVDEAFTQVPHRHYVSHFVWGDRVRSDRDEDRILTDRRRLLYHYGAVGAAEPLRRLGVLFGSPLDGAPRVVSSGLGSERDGGHRSHRGVDLESLPNEPVRAIADGRVVFAGIDLPGHQAHRPLRRSQYDSVGDVELGAGGRFVCIAHDRPEGDPLRSCYMHLRTVEVEFGQQAARGDIVGTVGRTGMRSSAAHLHLELHGRDELYDASQVLRGLIIGDPDPEI